MTNEYTQWETLDKFVKIDFTSEAFIMDVLTIPCDLERRNLRHKAYFMNSP